METRLRRGKGAGRLDGMRDSWSRDPTHLQRSKRVRERVCTGEEGEGGVDNLFLLQVLIQILLRGQFGRALGDEGGDKLYRLAREGGVILFQRWLLKNV